MDRGMRLLQREDPLRPVAPRELDEVDRTPSRLHRAIPEAIERARCGELAPGHLAVLQRLVGNRAVGELVARQGARTPALADDGAEDEEFVITGPAAPLEMEAHDKVRLSSFSAPQEEQTSNPDRGHQFGLTSSQLSYTADIRHNKNLREYAADVELKQVVRWETASGAGPNGQVDIPSATAPAITGLNNHLVADDLTPNPADAYPGRPPRHNFWAEDLTKLHEQFHVAEYKKFFKEKVKVHQPKIARGDVGDKPTLRTRIDATLNSVFEDVRDAVALPGGEVRAYADGAAAYRARADAIRSGNYAFPAELAALYEVWAGTIGPQQAAIRAVIDQRWGALDADALYAETGPVRRVAPGLQAGLRARIDEAAHAGE